MKEEVARQQRMLDYLRTCPQLGEEVRGLFME
jgi:hypothetical protein